MARFRGTIQGHRGEASRLGTASSGLRTDAAGWQGAVTVWLYDKDGIDMARVELTPHHGVGTRKHLYDGPVNGKEFKTD